MKPRLLFYILFFVTSLIQAKTEIITGFEPFDGDKTNPSWEAVKRLPDHIGDITLIKFKLPVSFNQAFEPIHQAIQQYHPNAVIAVGLNAGSLKINIERVAINIDDASIPDNDGEQPIDQSILTMGKNAYFSTLAIKSIVSRLKQLEIPARISNSAGTYVCNHVMYLLLHELKQSDIKSGFIHVPEPNSHLTLEQMTFALLDIIVRETPQDARY